MTEIPYEMQKAIHDSMVKALKPVMAEIKSGREKELEDELARVREEADKVTRKLNDEREAYTNNVLYWDERLKTEHRENAHLRARLEAAERLLEMACNVIDFDGQDTTGEQFHAAHEDYEERFGGRDGNAQ